MDEKYNIKRIHPPIWQHDYHVLKRLYDLLFVLLKKYVSQKSGILLDYGCGSSPYKELFLPFIARYIGVDIGKNLQTDILIKENEPIPLKDSSVDIILSTQVLEHVGNVSFYLSECRRLLKKGGLLLLSTHGLWPYHPYPTDFHRWTKKGLVEEIEKFGLKCLENYSILGPFASVTQFTLLLIAERLILAKRSFMRRLIMAFLSLVGNGIIFLEDKLFPPNENSDSSLYVVCAKKIC